MRKLRFFFANHTSFLYLFFQAEVDWVVYKSPLWHRDTVQQHVRQLPGRKERASLESCFINDAIRTQVYHYPRKKPIIPVYSAKKDKFAQAYFQCPLVKTIIKRDGESETVGSKFQLFKHKTKFLCKRLVTPIFQTTFCE